MLKGDLDVTVLDRQALCHRGPAAMAPTDFALPAIAVRHSRSRGGHFHPRCRGSRDRR